jgi:hypothetical protein
LSVGVDQTDVAKWRGANGDLSQCSYWIKRIYCGWLWKGFNNRKIIRRKEES